MPYVFDTITSRDSLSAALKTVKGSRTIGIMLAKVKFVFRVIRVAIINSDNIIPFRHSSEDIR